MKVTSIILSTIFLLGCANLAESTNDAPEAIAVDTTVTNFNPELAKQLGADDYGMRSYVFATLLTGPNDATITDAEKRGELFKGHFANMGRLAKEGKLVLAGPFVEGAPKRGLFIFNVATIEEAEALVQSDPSIAAGIFKVEFTKYYGTAALMQVNDIHKQIQKIAIN